jgi:sterol desaturase/sphingolipid hydroxylase (fatty acid hydroxylase superfamily)
MEFVKGTNGLLFLAAALAAALVIERVAPWRQVARIDLARWARNLSMYFYGVVILGLMPFLAGYAGAIAAEKSGFGLFNQVAIPNWAELIATFIALDAVAFAQHRALHLWYGAWRLHRVHHSDKLVDATTSLRFHPTETIFRAATELPAVFVLGLSPEGMLLGFTVLALANTATHMNIALPAALERALSTVIVTPGVHRLHHAAEPRLQNQNFGTVLTLWDRLSGTFAPPDTLSRKAALGLEGPEDLERESFANLALDPIRGRPR